MLCVFIFYSPLITRHGPIFRTSILGRPVVISTDREFNNCVLQQEGKDVELWYLDTLSKILGLNDDGLHMNSLGEVHKYIRSTLLRQFGVESLKEKSLISQLEQYVNTTLREWSTQASVNVKFASGIVSFTMHYLWICLYIFLL